MGYWFRARIPASGAVFAYVCKKGTGLAMRAIVHHRPVFLVFIGFFKIFLPLKFHMKTRPADTLDTPCLILSNHTTSYDPMILGTSFPMLLHYLASDHIFRLGLVSRLIVALGDPIPRLKATTEVAATKRILMKLRGGDSVCIFPEGNRTWSGETVEIPESVGKLAKKAGVTLVTYHIRGGYFSSPRWSRYSRKGKITGSVVSVYTSDQIDKMTADELGEAIRKDLYVNAYDDQQVERIAYRGKNIAEDLELALYLCPCCGRIGTLESKGDTFSCPCGLDLRYNVYGNFEIKNGMILPYPNVLEWFRWQQTQMKDMVIDYISSHQNAPMFQDLEQELFLVERASSQRLVAKGFLEFYGDRLQLISDNGDCLCFPLIGVTGMSIHGPKVLVFSLESGESYEVRTTIRRSAVKYLDAFNTFNALISLETTE
jgi:1-acyl-sn-glycerol-3-phosphate acyltransferase